MRLTFHSIDNNGNKTIYQTEYEYIDNTYIFKDKSTPNTIIYLTILNNEITWIRKGQICMEMNLSLYKDRNGHYDNNQGLAFDFITKTSQLKINKNKIEIEYSLFVMGDLVSTHKIWIIFH